MGTAPAAFGPKPFGEPPSTPQEPAQVIRLVPPKPTTRYHPLWYVGGTLSGVLGLVGIAFMAAGFIANANTARNNVMGVAPYIVAWADECKPDARACGGDLVVFKNDDTWTIGGSLDDQRKMDDLATTRLREVARVVSLRQCTSSLYCAELRRQYQRDANGQVVETPRR